MNKQDFKQLRVGDKVQVSQSYKKFWQKEHFEMGTRQGKLEGKDEIGQYFAIEAVSLSFPYTAEVLKKLDYTGNGANGEDLPGCKIEIHVGPYSTTTIIGYDDLIRCKKRAK